MLAISTVLNYLDSIEEEQNSWLTLPIYLQLS